MSADRARLRELLDAGTQGPWEQTGEIERLDLAEGHAFFVAVEPNIGIVEQPADAALIAAAVTALPGLLDALDRVEALADELERTHVGQHGRNGARLPLAAQIVDRLRAVLGEMDDSAERGQR